ncbi:MAG TPA: DUF1800 domain-containing protein [Candidatus Kapabacteria bacterium]|nr:DUF1800 domain-containing protein [Candidatus Kapabacteria bacterium]
MRKVPSPTAITLDQYNGPWGAAQAAHLLRRTMFGATPADITALQAMTMSQAVDSMLTLDAAPTNLPLIWYHGDSNGTNDGQTWVGLVYNSMTDFNRTESLGGWWISLMLFQNRTIREKMTLFWHNHFSCGATTVGDARYMYKQNTLLRANCLGNFKSLVKSITLDPAMLVYLSGNQNIASAPNENYGRELQELFTIGKGTEVSAGDYTTYTEADVKAAARVLTGWADDATSVSAFFTSAKHDASNKQFSGRYNNTVITGASDQTGATRELDDLLTMIFSEQATAEYICRKIFRWFVDYVIDDSIEQNVIVPLAQTLISNNFEIKPVMSQLLKSSLFYDPAYTGCVIKPPTDLIIGSMRLLNVTLPDTAYITNQYYGWIGLRDDGENMQQKILEPPNVAGWPEYYEAPSYHELWINSGTLNTRLKFLTAIATNTHQNPVHNELLTSADLITLAKTSSDPSNPLMLISDLAALFFPNPLTSDQMTTLHDQLLPGLPDYEWTNEWSAFTAAPTDATKKAAVVNKLTILINYMVQLPEYQLM